MTAAPAVGADPAHVTRRDRIGSTRVLWRFAEAPPGSAADISRHAHEVLAELVRDDDLFPWRGLERADAWSKPRPVGEPDADVSLSHSGRLILVAACVGARIGVDVERAPFSAFDAPALQRRMCTPAEAATSALLDDGSRRAYLARVWTAKEALTKATGTGLGTDFRTLEVEASVSASAQPFEAHLCLLDDRTTLRRLTTEETP